MQIVIPMAGEGKRFLRAGYKNLKTLIQIENKPIIKHVIDLFPGEDDFLFIVNSLHIKRYNIHKILNELKPTAKIVEIDPHNLGPVETVLRAGKYINKNKPTVINYCDFSMYWDYQKFKNQIKNKDGAIICYKGFHPHLLKNNLYAGVKADERNMFIETREKYSFTPNLMNSWQSAGSYYFKNGKIAKDYLKKIKTNNLLTNNEYYIPWAYNFMKKDNLNIIVYPVEYFCQWGTPEDLEEYLYWSKYFNK